MAARGRPTSYFSRCCMELLNPMLVIFYKQCFKLKNTIKLLRTIVDSRACGASEQKDG